MIDVFIWLGVALIAAFAFVIAFGAPYLPTLSPQINAALDLADLKEGQTLIELGSGDGRVLIAAAEKGARAIGYELNPVLAFYSWARTRKYKGRVQVVWGNFWTKSLPEADVIFVFLLHKYMPKLDQKIVTEVKKPVRLVSFAFRVPGREVDTESHGVFLYRYG